MDRESFNLLVIEKQVKAFNELLKKRSIRKTCKELKIGKTTIRNRFEKNDYVFNREENQYIKNDQNMKEQKEMESNIKITKKEEGVKENTNTVKRKKEIKSNINITEEMYQQWIEIVDMREDLKAIVNIWKEQATTSIRSLNIKKFDGNLYVKSIKLYEEVLEGFNEFVDGHRELKQQEIINQALWEFLEKYR
ncbi:hypothetical protein [Marinisporobacter balticus]|uniref:Uncharacterized protein n=1 Tax=Marinisporobacter balticus TaxID=2018667 RepID=A0A4R2KUC5_9FIRM|nr:hypothetical protein [Marinisporobacter balticus]TCO76482.1 hypothetical protein EV214_10885 [Marinisporobacter balticus]